MPIKKAIILFILFIPLTCFSQLRNETDGESQDSIPSRYFLDAAKLCEQIFTSIPEKYKKDSIYKIMAYQYACKEAYYTRKQVSDGSVYSDLPELENYFHEILNEIMPEELKNDPMVNVYIYKDGTANAHSLGSGIMMINIGLLADITDEATLAYIFLHELAHYYLKHQLRGELATQTGKFDRGLLDRKEKLEFIYSINEEYATDSLAIIWLGKTGYSMQGGISANKEEERYVNNMYYQGINYWANTYQTRKLARERSIDLLNRMEKSRYVKGELFLISEEKFKKLKEEAKPEILSCLMNNFEYNLCIEKAFKFHLFDPKNIIYINYLLESIRKYCYLDKKNWEELFITDQYNSFMDDKGLWTERIMKYNLFKTFDSVILNMSYKEANDIIAKFYWNGEPKFSTYNQAFDYFFRLSQPLQNKECFLSAALSYTDDTLNMYVFLDKYLANANIENKQFAERLKVDSVYTDLPNKKLLVLNRIIPIIKLGKDEVVNFYYADTAALLSMLCNKLSAEIENSTCIYLPRLIKTDLNKYSVLKELQTFSFVDPFFYGKYKAQLHIIDPKYYFIFKDFNVNEIVFINCCYFEDRKPGKSLNAYRNVANEDYEKLINMNYGTRFIEILITNVRIQKNNYIHLVSSLKEHDIEQEGNGVDEIIAFMKSDLLEFFKENKKHDDYNTKIK